MSKYGRENRRRTSRESLRAEPRKISWIQPEGSTNETTTAHRIGRFLYTQREVRIETNGMLVEFAIIVSEYISGETREVLCIDSCHRSNVHKHLNNHTEYIVLKELLFEGDLDEAFLQAVDEATDYCLDQIGENDD